MAHKYVLLIKLLLIVFLIGMVMIMLRIVEENPEASSSVENLEYAVYQDNVEE